MDFIDIILIITGLIIGFLIAKYLSRDVTWIDKKKAINAEWKLKLQDLESSHEKTLLKLDSKYKANIVDLKNNNEKLIRELKNENLLTIKRLKYDWELKYTHDLSEIKELIMSSEKYLRADAIRRSKRTLLGRLWEQVSPFIPKFPFTPSDMKFLGAPIDFIIFDGASENNIKQVIFLEVKSGDSKLNKQEKKLKEVIESGNVIWKLFNIDKPEEIKLEEEEEKETIQDEIKPSELHKHIDKKINYVEELIENDNVDDEDIIEQNAPKPNFKINKEGNYEDTFICPECNNEVIMEITPDEDLKEGIDVTCPHCKENITLSDTDIKEE